MKQINSPIKSEYIPLYVIRAYIVFVVIAVSVFYIDSALFRELPDKWFGFSVASWALTVILGPLNTIIILLLFLLKINKEVLLKLKITIFEALTYSLIAVFLDTMNFIPKQAMNYSFLFPYIVIIPLLIIQTLIKKSITDIAGNNRSK